MKRCPKCNSEYREESRFCPRDGIQLESIPTIVAKPTPSLTEERRQYVSESLAAGAVKLCPQCGSEFPPKARYCYRDGSRLQEVPITPDGDEETQPEEKVEKVEQKETNKDKLVGRTIAGHYKLVKKIGQGGMAVVYKAEHIRISRPSAIKILNPDLTGTPELVERFGREAEMASRINHPNAAGIYDVGEEEDGLVYITMEFVDGEPLSRIIKREGPLPLDRVVNIIRQVADALDAMSVQRPYRGPLHFDAIREEFLQHRGTQFDPVVADAAVDLYRSYDDLHAEAQRRWNETHGPERLPSPRRAA